MKAKILDLLAASVVGSVLVCVAPAEAGRLGVGPPLSGAPEPATLALLGIGLAALGVSRR